VLRDVANGTAKPIYNYLDNMPQLSSAVPPILPSHLVKLVLTQYSSFDAGRGCPFQCSFCTIINVQGRISRYRTADDVEAIVRANAAQGVTRFFVTDDNFARNRNWEAILDRLIELREREKFRIKLILQVDTLCHRIPHFIEKSARAGATFVFIGLENINPESLLGTKKRQNKIWEYREMLLAWRRHRVITYAGYILGFPTDTPESIARDIEIIKKELPSIFWNSFVSRRCRAPRTIRSFMRRASTSIRTSTNTTLSMPAPTIRACHGRNGRKSTGTRLRATTPTSMWKRSCAAR
jgi:radical SAM superfamily enzyme YgiQ (UPF0313 family)